MRGAPKAVQYFATNYRYFLSQLNEKKIENHNPVSFYFVSSVAFADRVLNWTHV